MSFWKRLFKGGSDDAEAKPAPAPAATTDAHARAQQDIEAHQQKRRENTVEEAIERVRHCGRSGGASLTEALAELRTATGATQSRILEAALEALDGTALDGTLQGLDPLRLTCAGLLEQRGERRRAVDLISDSRSVEGLMMAADMYAEAGELARAVSAIERVMARNIDMPGARERHQRWCQQLGRLQPDDPRQAGATVVAPAVRTETHFRLLREVARGGAGTVYEAEDGLLGRRLAYKIYHQPKRHQEQLLREARVPARLFGPGVVRVYECDPEAGWIAYEWARAGSLRDRLHPDQAAALLPLSRWWPDLIAALVRVHDAGLIHGDLKPGNVLFRGPGEPILTDFGQCRAPDEPLQGGTPGYMSPERLGGLTASYADDVYALGRILEDALNALNALEVPTISAETRTASATETQAYARAALRCMTTAAKRPSAAQLLALL